MKPRHRALVAALLAIPAGLRPDAALAAERACPGVTIEADAGFRGHWPDLLERLHSELSARTDVDACARVGLRLEGDAIITVSVRLVDGRAASRSVTERDDVIPLLQALLLVPEVLPAPAAPSPPTPAAPRAKAIVVEGIGRTERDEPPATTVARPLGVELSLITGVRMGGGQLGVGAGALSFLELNGWLIGFEGRADSYRAMGGGDSTTALELALLAGRRLDLGSVALDLTAGPAVAMDGFGSSQAELRRVSATASDVPSEMPPPIQGSVPGSGAAPRLLLGARLGFRPRSVFRTFVGFDAEVGLARAGSDASSSRLPGFSAGFCLGVSVGTP